MNLKSVLLLTALSLLSCSQKNTERDLLFAELNKQILEDDKRILELEQVFLFKHEDKPDWYKEKTEKEFSEFRNSIDSLLNVFEKISSKKDLINYHKSLESFVDNKNVLDNYKEFHLSEEIEDQELQILYNKRAVAKLHFDYVRGYHMGLISFPLSEIYPDEFEQYEFLKEKFKAYEK